MVSQRTFEKILRTFEKILNSFSKYRKDSRQMRSHIRRDDIEYFNYLKNIRLMFL